MSIAVFSNFVNGIPTTIYDGKDVSMVMLVDPPANLPAFFLAGKGILDTTSQTIKVYDETGNNVIHDFDISGADLLPINEAISALDGRVSTNEGSISSLSSDVSGNTSDIATNTDNISSLTGRTSALESTTSQHSTDIIALQSATGGNASDISALTLRVGQNETDIVAVLITANAADTLSKQNKERLDNLPAPPSLEGYIKTGDDATLNSVSFGDNTKIDTQPDLGLVLQGDYIYAKSDSEYEHFFVESGNFNVKSKKIQKVNDGQAVDDAVNLRQLNAVESKADAAQSTADGADTLSKVNQTAISNLSTTVGNNISGISTNAKDIGDLSTKVGEVEDVANAADTLSKNNKDRLDNLPEGGGLKPINSTWDMLGYPILNVGTSEETTSGATVGQVNAVKTVAESADALSKANKTRLDNLPPSPDLSGYVKNGDDVNFGTAEIQVAKIVKGDEHSKFSEISIDGNTNTEMNLVGDTHVYQKNKDTGDLTEIFQIDSSHRFNVKTKIKTPIITTPLTGTTNSNSDNAAFIDLSLAGEVKLGAKSKVAITVGGNEIVDFADTGFKLLRDADANNHTISKMGDLKFSTNYQIEGSSANNLKVRNVGGVYGDDSTDDTSVRFSGTDVKYKATHHQYYSNGSNSQVFGVSGAGANLFNHNVLNVKHLLGNSAGTMNVAGISVLKRDDESDNTDSIHFNSGNLTHFSDKHEWKTNDNARRLTIENHTADWHDCQLKNVTDADDDKDVPSFKQLKTIVSTKWFEIVTANLASDGNRPTGASSDGNINVWHTTVSSTTNPPNELKIDNAVAVKEALSWTNPLRYKLVQGDKVQYWETNSNGWSTSTSVWHLSATKVSGDDLAIGEETKVYASFLEESDGGNSPQEMDGFKKYVQPTSSVTYYAHQGDSHLYIEYRGNGGTVSLDTMRSGSEQTEDITILHNTTPAECALRLFFNGSSVTHTVPPKSYIQGWANRDMGRWATVITKEASEVTEQLVVKSTDLNWETNSDPRTNTKRMIAAAPNMCTIIGRHNASGSAKEKIVSVGSTNKVETQTSTFVINKYSSGHATGICTSEESSGKTWSRILDGTRGAWFTNESANSRMASVDINPEDYPENQLFFTTDQGIMETYIIDDTGEIGLRVLEGYNVPKNEQDIAALEVQTEKNRSVTHYFINEGDLSYDWPDETRRPLVEVGVLNTTQTINNSSVTVTDNDTHRYSGTYNTVGSIAINTSGDWTNQYTYHNCYKHVSESYYVVFNQGNVSWQLIESANPHTSIGSHAASVTVQLGGQTSLPESFGNYTIDPNFDNIDSLEFLSAEVPIQYDDVNSRVLINFNGAKPSGYVVLK
ncbi:coil containing protein [Vibrio phage 1.084.O._10N.261.49.F5]|nr:coil containing protein [Vibrio phage 1.084.O._10N.261.49.F5]